MLRTSATEWAIAEDGRADPRRLMLRTSVTSATIAEDRLSRYSRACSTSAPTARLRSSASGCHWTPSTKRQAGASIASGRSVEHPNGRSRLRPSPTSSIALMVVDSCRAPPRPAARAASEPGVEADVVVGVRRSCRGTAVVLVADEVGQVLVQRAARRHVEQLHAAADAEHGHVALDRPADERDLGVVTLGHGAVRLRMRLGAVEDGSMSAPPARISPSMRSSISSGFATRAGSGGIIIASAPARWIAVT